MWRGPDLLQVLVVPALLATSVGNIFPVEMDLDDLDIPSCKEIYPDEEKSVFSSYHPSVRFTARLSPGDVCFVGIIQDVSFRCCENRVGIRQGMALVRFEALTIFWGGEVDNYDILLWRVNIPGCVNYLNRVGPISAQSDLEIGNKYVVSATRWERSGMLEAPPDGLVKCENMGTQGGVVAENCPRLALEVAASLAKSFSFKRVNSESDFVVTGTATKVEKYPPPGETFYFNFKIEECLSGELSGDIKVTMFDKEDEMTWLPYYEVEESRRYLLCLRNYKEHYLPTRGKWSVFELRGNLVFTWTGHLLGKYPEYFGM